MNRLWLLRFMILGQVIVIVICARILIEHYCVDQKRCCQDKKCPRQEDQFACMLKHLFCRLRLFFCKQSKKSRHILHLKGEIVSTSPRLHSAQESSDSLVHHLYSPNKVISEIVK